MLNVKRVKYFTLLFAFFYITSSYGQTITGVIANEQAQPLEFVSVFLKKDTTVVATAITDSVGHFTIRNVNQGRYSIIFSLVNYKVQEKEFEIVKDISFKIIQERDSNKLSTVVVVSNKPLIERKIDRIIFNVEQSITAKGGTFYDALNKSPGVRSDNFGNISAMGKGAIVYIDNKPIKLGGEDLIDFLKSKASDDISKIEIYSNPPSRFDADGAAVINISSKKKITLGYDASIRTTYRQSAYAKYGTGTTINFNENKIKATLNYTYNNAKNLMEETEYVYYKKATTFTKWDLSHNRIQKPTSHDYKLGLDYEITKKDLLSFQFDGFNKVNYSNRFINAIITEQNILFDSSINTNNNFDNTKKQYSYNANYTKAIDQIGKSFSVDFDYTKYNSLTDQNLKSSSFDFTGNTKNNLLDAVANSNQDIKIFTAKTDYSNPINDTSGFELGYKYGNITTDNNFVFFNNSNGNYIIDNTKSNVFNYSEQNQAAYFSYYSTIKKIDFQIGLRAEYTQTKGYSKTVNQTTKTDYFKLFPTLYLQYQINLKSKLNLNYGKRITRPDYWRLNPFRNYTTPNSYLQGNPFLTPSFTHNIELIYALKSKYFFTVYYTQTNKPFSNITEQDNSTNFLVNNQINLDRNKNIGILLSAPFSYGSWYEANLYTQFAYRQEQSVYLSSKFNYSTLFFYGSLNNSFILSKNKTWRAELSAWYASKGIQGIYKLGSTFDVSAGIKKSFSKSKWNISANVNDIFYRTYYRIDVDYLDQKNGFIERNDTRLFTLSLSYRFSKNKSQRVKLRTVGNDDERKRTNN